MANLFICDTPFQVMASLLLSWGHFDSTDFDCIVTDNMPGAATIVEKMSTIDSVRDARVAHVKHRGRSRVGDKIRYFTDLMAPYNQRWPDGLCDRVYERLFARNYTDPFVISAYSHFRAANDGLRFFVYDEGYSTYSKKFWISEKGSFLHFFANRIASSIGKQLPSKHIESAYLLDPNLMRFDLPFPMLRLLPEGFFLNAHRLKCLNTVFDFKDESDPLLAFVRDKSTQGKKIIFFEESFATDYGNEKDLQVLDAIAKATGKDRDLVKLHPRSTKDRFSELGYRVLQSNGYPWEIAALNMPDEADVVLVSGSSGSLLNYRFLCSKSIKSVFLYDLFPQACASLDDDERSFFEAIYLKYPDDIIAPKSKQELTVALNA